MSELEARLRRYADARARGISHSDADLLVTRALASPSRRPGWTRHGLNAGLALGIALLLIVGGVVLKSQLRGQPSGLGPTHGPLPAVPNEIVDLDDPSQDPSLETPFNLKTGKVLAPVLRWVLPQNRAFIVYSTSDCSSSTIRIVDRLTQKDTQPEVRLPDCYATPILLPGTSVLLSHWKRPNSSQNQVQDLGEVMYDWSMARIVKSYAPPSASFTGGLVSADGSLLYTLDAFSDSPTLDIIDLTSGARLAHAAIPLVQVGLNPGGLALSIDGKTLYVNKGDSIATFDARTGSPGPVLMFKDSKSGSTSLLPGWLAPIDADAKEGLEVGHGIAVDPLGRWVAALGAANPETEGAWLFSLKGTPHLVRRIDQIGGLGGIAFSRDGSVLYAIERQSYLVVIDPQTGQKIKEFRYPQASGVYGIAGVEAP
jgi:hypothetical protein